VGVAYVPWARTKGGGSIEEGPTLCIIAPQGFSVQPKFLLKPAIRLVRADRGAWIVLARSDIYLPDVDAHYDRAKAAGAEIVVELRNTEYGSREYSARDLEGHVWHFGTYLPEM
jgi:hypothetical protein